MLSEYRETTNANVPLSLSVQEKRALESSANMVSIIRAVEKLENSFVNGYIPTNDYTNACNMLISQFKVQQPALKEKYPDFSAFWVDQKLDCELSKERLLASGVPASMLHNMGKTDETEDVSVHVFDACTHTMTLTDALKLNYRAVDELLPTVKEVLGSVNKISSLPPDMEGREQMKGWLITLNQMAADDNITDSQARQFAMDVESFYVALYAWLKAKK